MDPDQNVPLLTLLTCFPALGALIVAVAAPSRATLASWLAVVFAGINVALALMVLTRAGAGWMELYPWIPTLGISFALEADGLSAVLVAWVAVASFLALVSSLSGSRTAVLVLSLESAVTGLFLSADVFLAFAFLGGAIVVIALLSETPRGVLVAAAGGMTLSLGWFVRFYQMVFDQSGFPATALARWQSLVLYPSQERSLFVLGSLGVLFLIVAIAIAIDHAPRPHRPVLLGVAGLVGSFLVIRFLVPFCPRGAEASSGWVLVLVVALMVVGGLARGWTLIALGYQSVVLFGLFSFQESVVLGATLMMIVTAVGVFGSALASSSSLPGLRWFFVLPLVTLPVVTILVPASRGDALWAVVGTLAFAALGYRIVDLERSGRLGGRLRESAHDPSADESATPDTSDRHARRAGMASVALVVVSCVSVALGWNRWDGYAKPWAVSFMGSVIVPDDDP